MYTPRFSLALLALLASTNIYAQNDTIPPEIIYNETIINNTKVLYFGDEAPVDSSAHRVLLDQFYQDQFRHAQDPRAPYFLMMSRTGQLGMGIGGELRMVGAYDWDGSQNGAAFVPYNIPIPVDPTARNLTQLTPSRTALYFTVFGNNATFGKFLFYVHAKFCGPENTFKLDRAYATVGNWTFGYAKSTFDDPTAQPSTVEIEGPNSEIDDTRVLARWMHPLSKNFSMAVSVENPTEKVPTTTTTTPITSSVPDFAAFLQLANRKDHIRLSGIVRTLGYRDLVKAQNAHVTAWGLNLSAKVHPVLPLTIYAAVNTGKGIGSFVNDLQYGSNDLLGLTDDPGRMYAPQSYGWYGALQYNYTPAIFSTVIFSQERILPKSTAAYAGDNYKYGLYGTANIFWNLTPRMQLAAEFSMGKRCNIDGTSRLGYRTSIMADFSF